MITQARPVTLALFLTLALVTASHAVIGAESPAHPPRTDTQRAAPRAVPGQTTAEPAPVPPPFKKEWFYMHDRPVMWNRIVTQIGEQAPELDVQNWRGDAISIEKSEGDIVVLNFWATWCGPCKAAMPTMNTLAKEYAEKGVRIIGICDDEKGADTFAQICEQQNLQFPAALDTDGRSTGKKYERQWFPFIVIVDRHGAIRAKGLKPDALKDALNALLQEQPPIDKKSSES